MEPLYLEVWGKFTPRGGISIDPYVNYGKKYIELGSVVFFPRYGTSYIVHVADKATTVERRRYENMRGLKSLN